MARTPKKLLDELEEAKQRFGSSDENILRALGGLSRTRSADAASLLRLHETLLFLRAYPPSARVLRQVKQNLKTFDERVARLGDAEADLSAFDDPEVSGIAGGSVTSNFSYAVARWLAAKYPRQISIDWDWFEEEDRFGATMPQFLPLLEDDAMVEAHVPYREWLRAARGRKQELSWLISRFESLPISDRAKSELYDSLKLHITWRYNSRSSRTGMKLPVKKVFFHDQPLIQRRDVSLIAELNSKPIPVQKLSRAEGENILDLARETSAVRYRELHGFTYGDAHRGVQADLGRGTLAFVFGVPPENRLPLRAYHAAIIFKDGVPVAYFEGLSIFERMESGFNLYYTFREGETAWLYARVLRLMRQLLGVTVFSIDPYQVGHENEEGIESGAFWFYRKLGFRPVNPELMKLTVSEESKMANNPRHRTSPRMLRRLASGHMLFELPNSRPAQQWDKFSVRNVGLAVQRRMATNYDGDAQRIRAESTKRVARALGADIDRWTKDELHAFENLALVLAANPNIEQWRANEKDLALKIIRAKAGANEAQYLRLMQKHEPLRESFLRIGS